MYSCCASVDPNSIASGEDVFIKMWGNIILEVGAACAFRILLTAILSGFRIFRKLGSLLIPAIGEGIILSIDLWQQKPDK